MEEGRGRKKRAVSARADPHLFSLSLSSPSQVYNYWEPLHYLLFGAGMSDGNAHDPHKLPIVLAGRGGGSLATGRALAYANNTPLTNLYVALLQRMGTPVEKFADSTGELAGLGDAEFKGLAT